jgi:hypothetical protein
MGTINKIFINIIMFDDNFFHIVNSIVLLTNGISFAIQAVLLLLIGAWADYGRWRFVVRCLQFLLFNAWADKSVALDPTLLSSSLSWQWPFPFPGWV